MKRYLYLLPVLLLCSYSYAATWTPHPLRTEAQQLAGIAGGEGNQWQKVIEYAPSDPNIVFKGVDTSSIWKSTDGGASWVHKSKGITAVYARGIAISPTDPNKVCVAMRPLYGGGMYGSTGIFRTTDGGDNWTYVHHAPTGSISGFEMTDVITWEGTSNTLYCGSQSKGIVKSTDEGLTWANLTAGGTHTFSGCQVTNVQVDPTNTNILFACVTNGTSSTGLHKLTISGTSVTARQYLSASKGGSSFPNKAFKTANGNIYICRYSGDTRGIYRSTDGGSTFSAINSGITSLSSYSLYGFEVSNDGLRAAVTQTDRLGNSYWYCNNITAATPTWQNPVSVDVQNAKGWIAGGIVRASQASEQESSRPTAFHPTNSQIMLTAVQFDVLVKSTNGGQTWTFSNSGFLGVGGPLPFSQTDNNSVMWDITNPNRWMLSGGDYGARFTDNGGTTYKPMFAYVSPVRGRYDGVAGAIEHGGNVCIMAIGSPGNQELQRCADISVASPSFSTVLSGTHTYTYIAFNGSSTSTIYAGDRISYNKGLTWSTVPSGRTIGAINPRNHNTVYDAAQSGSNILIYKSTNSGSTWTQPFASCNISGFSYIGQFCIDPFDENRAYIAVRGKGIYTITTSSATLSTTGLVKSTSGYYDFTSVACDPKTPGVVYTAAFSGYAGINGNGVFKSTDYGTTWTELVELGGTADVTALNVSPHTGIVFSRGYMGTYLYNPNQSEAPPPSGGSPSVSTGTATAVTQTTATLQGSVNPNSLNTTYRWQYNTANNSWGTATNTGSQTVSQSYGTQNVGVNIGVTGLTANTNYYTRIQANNGSGSVSGSTTTFATLATRKLFDVVKVATSTVTIDGNLSEWGTLENSIPFTTTGSPASAGTWSARWIDGSAGGLYFAIQVSDSNQYSDSGTGTVQLDDSVELYIDRDNNKGSTYDSYDRNIKLTYGSNTTMTINTGTTTGILQSGSNTPTLWTKEVFIPWSLFPGGAVPNLSAIIGFDVQLNDDNDGGTREGAKSWNNTVDTNYYDTSNFGEIQLQGYDYVIYDGCTVSTSNLVAYFAMNEISGTTTSDFSYLSNTGTITGALFVAGKSGNALDFDGVDDSLSFPNESYYDRELVYPMSMSAWIKIGTSASDQVIVTKILNGTPYSGYSFTVDDSGHPYSRLCNSYNTNVLEKYASSIVDDNQWHHIAFTYNGSYTASGLNLYVDGNLSNGTVTYNTLSLSILNNQKLTIGAHGGGGSHCNGLIDDVRIYTRELTSDEISCMYNNTTLLSVQSTNPGSGTAGVSLDSNVDVTFSKTLDSYWAGTVSVFTVGTVTGSVTPGTGTLQFNPTSNLNNNTTYPVTLSKRLRDTAGYPMADDYIYTFTTLAGTDTTAPIGTITLHNGATYATSTAITIDLSATDAVGVTGYFLSPGSTTPYATQTGWVMVGTSTNYAGKIPYTLSFIDGVKTIFGWFRDGAGNISSVTQDSVVLDTVFASVVINDPSQNCSLADGTAVYGTSGTTISLAGSAYDINLVQQVKILNSATSTVNTATGTETWTMSNLPIIGTLAGNIFSATGFDVAGNQGTDTIHIGAFPVPETGEALAITSNSATLTGTVTINDAGTTTVWVDYGAAVYNESTGEYEGYEAGSYPGSSSSTQAVSGTSVTDGLVFWDKMDNLSGHNVDVISGNVGTRTGGLQGQQGKIKYSEYFDGVDDYIEYVAPPEITTAVSVFAWVKPGTVSGYQATGVVRNNYWDGGYTLQLHYNNEPAFYAGDSPRLDKKCSSAIPVNVWSLIGFKLSNNGTLTVYKNTSPENWSASGFTLTDLYSNPLYIGYQTHRKFMGYIDDVRIYNRVLSNAEVLAIYNEGISGRQASVSIQLANLTPNTQYRYRLVGENDIGKTYALTEGEFTTLAGIGLPAGGNSSTILRWRSYDEFHTTDFHSYLKEIGKYKSFFKNIRSTQDWVDLIADPDAVISALPVD